MIVTEYLSLSPILPGSRAPLMSHSFLGVRLNSETAKWEYGVDRAMWSLESLSTSELGQHGLTVRASKSNGTILVRRIYAGFTPRAAGGRSFNIR